MTSPFSFTWRIGGINLICLDMIPVGVNPGLPCVVCPKSYVRVVVGNGWLFAAGGGREIR